MSLHHGAATKEQRSEYMIGYTVVGTNDIDRARTFYDELFSDIGATRLMELPRGTAWGKDWTQPMFAVATPFDGADASVGNGVMVALAAGSRPAVDKLHARALALGGTDEGQPGVRGDDPNGFYGAYFRDLDGNKLCAFHMGPA